MEIKICEKLKKLLIGVVEIAAIPWFYNEINVNC